MTSSRKKRFRRKLQSADGRLSAERDVDDQVVRAQVIFTLRHRESGCIIEGSRRIVIQMRGGLIGRYDLYEDGRRVEAFMRMARATTSEVESGFAALLASR